ncbi:MAG: ABC transporter substrate-binding protein [Bradyrhizobiaceae bacterium]|nr:ABC transporter substrate-binding protein [Bradyrhizobiaceae bacterium]
MSIAQAQSPRAIIDGRGRAVEIRDTSRIVTIGGAVTEIVFALGRGDNVVGVDLTSTFPSTAQKKPNIGYMRALSAEGVIALAPTLVLAVEGSGPPDVIEVLSNAAVPFVVVPEDHDEASVLRKVRFIAQALGEEERGAAMEKAIAEDFASIRAMRERIGKRRKATFVLAIGGGTPMVGGAGTSADGFFALSGVDNAMKSLPGYKPATAEASLAAAPDVVVTLLERNHDLSPDAMFALPAFAETPAARGKRLIPLPSYALAFGPRAAHAARDLAAAVYPDLALPDLPARPWTRDASAGKP